MLITCAIQWLFRNRKLYEFAEHISGPKAYPVIGSSYKFIGKNEEGELRNCCANKLLLSTDHELTEIIFVISFIIFFASTINLI